MRPLRCLIIERCTACTKLNAPFRFVFDASNLPKSCACSACRGLCRRCSPSTRPKSPKFARHPLHIGMIETSTAYLPRPLVRRLSQRHFLSVFSVRLTHATCAPALPAAPRCMANSPPRACNDCDLIFKPHRHMLQRSVCPCQRIRLHQRLALIAVPVTKLNSNLVSI
jgi:hypothetical protein